MGDIIATSARRFLTTKEVEALLGCSRTSLWRLRADKNFPLPIRKWADRRVLCFDAAEVEAFARERGIATIAGRETQSAGNCSEPGCVTK